MRHVAVNEPCLADKVTFTLEEAIICNMNLLLPTAKWLHESATMLRDTSIACLVYAKVN